MAIDPRKAPVDDGITLREQGGALMILLTKAFETGHAIDRWAFSVTEAASGPYHEIRVECAHLPTLSSTVIAGLVHLSDHFGARDAPVCLVNANERIRGTFKMMHLDDLFTWDTTPDG